MKLLGFLEVHRLHRHEVSGRRELPWDVLFQDLSPAARLAVAKVARSEVKNYLAELAEEAEVPFGSPAAFLCGVRDLLAETAVTNLRRQPQDGYSPDEDAPFGVVEGKPRDAALDEQMRRDRQAEYLRRVELARGKGLAPCSCPDCPDASGDCPHVDGRCSCCERLENLNIRRGEN